MIIYTCITNGYDVPEGHYIDPDVRYVLLHDGSVEVPDGWEGIDAVSYTHLTLPTIVSV